MILQDAARSHRAASPGHDRKHLLPARRRLADAVVKRDEPESDTDESTSSEQDQACLSSVEPHKKVCDAVAADPLVVPVLCSKLRSRVMSILWANWEVRTCLMLRLPFFPSTNESGLASPPDQANVNLHCYGLDWMEMRCCWQEPLQQTVKHIHAAFDALLDILEVQQEESAALGLSAQAGAATQAFLEETACEIMNAGEPQPWFHYGPYSCGTVYA